MSLLNLSVREHNITTFFKTLLQRSFKISLLFAADLLKAACPIDGKR